MLTLLLTLLLLLLPAVSLAADASLTLLLRDSRFGPLASCKDDLVYLPGSRPLGDLGGGSSALVKLSASDLCPPLLPQLNGVYARNTAVPVMQLLPARLLLGQDPPSSSYPCSVADMIAGAQLSGIQAVVFYGNLSTPLPPSNANATLAAFTAVSSDVTMPCLTVAVPDSDDTRCVLDLVSRGQTYESANGGFPAAASANNNNNNNNNQPSVVLAGALVGRDAIQGRDWQLPLVIVAGLLAAIFLTSMVLHLRLWASRNRYARRLSTLHRAHRRMRNSLGALVLTGTPKVFRGPFLLNDQQLQLLPTARFCVRRRLVQRVLDRFRRRASADLPSKHTPSVYSLPLPVTLSDRSERPRPSSTPLALNEPDHSPAVDESDAASYAPSRYSVTLAPHHADSASLASSSETAVNTTQSLHHLIFPRDPFSSALTWSSSVQVLDADEPTRPLNASCPICIERFIDQDVVRQLPCRHIYHPACCDAWLTQRAPLCPLCKFDVSRWVFDLQQAEAVV